MPSANMFLPRRGSVTSLRHSTSIGISITRKPLSSEVLDRLGIGGGDRRVLVVAPHALEQDRRARLEHVRPDPAEQHLLVERNREVRLIAAVADAALADPDADAARAGDAPCRRLDLRRDDLHRPDPVAHLRRDRAERLAAPLRALARVADHLDDVLADRDGRFSLVTLMPSHARSCVLGGRCRSVSRRCRTAPADRPTSVSRSPRYALISLAPLRPAPIASITVAAPVTMSPPAHTPAIEVARLPSVTM